MRAKNARYSGRSVKQSPAAHRPVIDHWEEETFIILRYASCVKKGGGGNKRLARLHELTIASANLTDAKKKGAGEGKLEGTGRRKRAATFAIRERSRGKILLLFMMT